MRYRLLAPRARELAFAPSPHVTFETENRRESRSPERGCRRHRAASPLAVDDDFLVALGFYLAEATGQLGEGNVDGTGNVPRVELTPGADVDDQGGGAAGNPVGKLGLGDR